MASFTGAGRAGDAGLQDRPSRLSSCRRHLRQHKYIRNNRQTVGEMRRGDGSGIFVKLHYEDLLFAKHTRPPVRCRRPFLGHDAWLLLMNPSRGMAYLTDSLSILVDWLSISVIAHGNRRCLLLMAVHDGWYLTRCQLINRDFTGCGWDLFFRGMRTSIIGDLRS